MEPTGPLQPAMTMGALNWLWGYFIPLGLLLLAWAGLPPRKARRVTPLAATAMALGILGYWAVGFAFHMGGAYTVNPNDPSLQGLQRLFSIVPGDPGWGVIGLAGFFLSDDAMTPTVFGLFLTYLPLVVSTVLLVTLALVNTRRWIMITAGALAGTVVMPVAAAWMWGSGWLAQLGMTLELGHGFVDFGGGTLVLWLPGMMVLPILLLQPREAEAGIPEAVPVPPPTNHFPLFASLGSLLLGLGWLGWGLSQPFHLSGVALDWYRTAVNILLGMAGAVVTAQLYAWLATGEPGALLAAQGFAAGCGALLAGAPFLPSWAALMIGLLAGLIFPIVHYFVHTVLRVRDAAAVVALALTSGPLGVLGVAFLADGRWGRGWNTFGTVEDVVSAPGVAGVFASGSLDQLSAQLAGLVVVALWAILWGAGLGIVSRPRLTGILGRLRHLRSSSGLAAEPVVEADVAAETAPEAEEDVDVDTGDMDDQQDVVDDQDETDETTVTQVTASGQDGDGALGDGESAEARDTVGAATAASETKV